MSTPTAVPEDLAQKIRRGNRFLISSHANPDGDAIGSEIGLARVLRQLGKSATIWNRDETPTIYQALPGIDRIRTGPEAPSGFPEIFDTVIVLECPTLDRTALDDELDGTEILNIDHHLGNQHYGSVNWVDTGAPAVGEMVFRLARHLKVDLDSDTATALYLTLVTDTGGFRFSNATVAAFEAAAALVQQGASPEQVAQWLYESQPEAMMRLLGEMMQTLELHAEGRIATVNITLEMYRRAGASRQDSEGLIDYPRSIAGVIAVALIRELEDGKVKVSLRSRGEVDVERVAHASGGGGHRNAAGFTAAGAIDETRGLIVEQLTKILP